MNLKCKVVISLLLQNIGALLTSFLLYPNEEFDSSKIKYILFYFLQYVLYLSIHEILNDILILHINYTKLIINIRQCIQDIKLM